MTRKDYLLLQSRAINCLRDILESIAVDPLQLSSLRKEKRDLMVLSFRDELAFLESNLANLIQWEQQREIEIEVLAGEKAAEIEKAEKEKAEELKAALEEVEQEVITKETETEAEKEKAVA